MSRLLALLALLTATACHARFKKYAPTLGEVRTQVMLTGGPYVHLGHVAGDGQGGLVDLAAVAINVTQTVKEIDQTERIARAVRVEGVNAAMEGSLARTLGQGPPFAWTDRPDAGGFLQIEVLSYGLEVPALGAPGLFTWHLRTRIYKQDGRRVYTARTDCSANAGDPSVASIVFGTVNNVKQLREMSDEEIQYAFEGVGAWCGQEVVRRMRKHAG